MGKAVSWEDYYCLKIRSKNLLFPDEFILILEAKNIQKDGPEIMQSDAL